MEKLNPSAVIFDLGSTLIEYESIPWPDLIVLCTESARKFFESNGHSVPPAEDFRAMLEEIKNEYRKLATSKNIEWSVPKAVGQLLKKLEIEDSDGLVDNIFDAYYKPVAKQLSRYDDTIPILEKIKGSGRIVGLVSNTIFPERAHKQELKRFKIEEYLDFAIFSSTFGLRKPHPDIFYKAANQAGLAPSECVYIGDRYIEDVTGPRGIGMHAILKRLEKREYPSEMPDADRIVENLEQLADHITF